MVTVYFIPFELETYIPITPATIKCQALEKWAVSDETQVSHLIDILKQGVEATFDDHRVRVKVSVHNKTYYIDSEGVVRKGKKNYKIDKLEFTKFGESLKPDQRLSIKEHHCEKGDKK
jgi:hypothetical protein